MECTWRSVYRKTYRYKTTFFKKKKYFRLLGKIMTLYCDAHMLIPGICKYVINISYTSWQKGDKCKGRFTNQLTLKYRDYSELYGYVSTQIFKSGIDRCKREVLNLSETWRCFGAGLKVTMKQGMQEASRNQIWQGNIFLPRASRKNSALLRSWFDFSWTNTNLKLQSCEWINLCYVSC